MKYMKDRRSHSIDFIEKTPQLPSTTKYNKFMGINQKKLTDINTTKSKNKYKNETLDLIQQQQYDKFFNVKKKMKRGFANL